MSDFFRNVQLYPSEQTLFQPEIDVILAVLEETLTAVYDEHVPRQGSLILDGQKFGEEAKCIARLNFMRGDVRYDYAFGSDISSDVITAQSINVIIGWPRSSAYVAEPLPSYFGLLPTGIYSLDRGQQPSLIVLVLNTTFGRFLASCRTGLIHGNCYLNADFTAFATLAETFRQLGKEDLVLQKHSEGLITELCNQTDCDRAIIIVRQLFSDCSLPALQVWKAWHEPANQSGELPLFFA